MLWVMQDKCHTDLSWQLPHPHFSHPVPSLTPVAVVLSLLVHVQQRQVVPLAPSLSPHFPHTSHTPFPPSPHL